MIERIIVLPRWRAESLDLNQRCRLISITDPAPFGQPAAIKPRWCLDMDKDLLRLAFDDVETCSDFGGHTMYPITAQHGLEIAGFAASCPHPVLVIHCEAGVSRSPSAALAIADSMSISHDRIEWDGFSDSCPRSKSFPPNHRVYRAVLAGFSQPSMTASPTEQDSSHS